MPTKTGRKPFPKPSQETTIINVRGVKKSTYKWLRLYAFQQERGIGEVLTEVIEAFKENRGGNT